MKLEYSFGLNLFQTLRYKYSKKYKIKVDKFIEEAKKSLGERIELKKENKRLNKKKDYIKNTLFNFRQKCWDKMVVIDSKLFLPNQEFNVLFEKLINKFRNVKGG